MKDNKEILDKMTVLKRPLDIVHFSFSFMCNLKCVYCPQSLLDYPDMVMSKKLIDSVIQFVVAENVKEVGIGYYGETSCYKGWEKHIAKLLSYNKKISGCSNFDLPLSPDEVDVLSCFELVQISLDASDDKVLKQLRPPASVKNITSNVALIRDDALKKNRKMPKLEWACTLTDKNVPYVLDLLRFAVANKISSIRFNDVEYYEETTHEVKSIFDLRGDAFIRAADKIKMLVSEADKYGVTVGFAFASFIDLVEKIKKIIESDSSDSFVDEEINKLMTRVPVQGIAGNGELFVVSSKERKVVAGKTKMCIAPWSRVYVLPDGNVCTCCVRGESMGKISETNTLKDILNNAKYRDIRRQLLTGDIKDEVCFACPFSRVVDTAELQNRVKSLCSNKKVIKTKKRKIREGNCLIVRSANDKILAEAIDEYNDDFANIDVLSNRECCNFRVRNSFSFLNIKNSRVFIETDKKLRSYDSVIVLIDLHRYFFFDYIKFIKFARSVGKKVKLFYGKNEKISFLTILKKDYLKLKARTAPFLKKTLQRLLFFGLNIIKPIKKITFCSIRTDRIGHLAANNDVFLRRVLLEKDKSFYVGVINPDERIANKQILTMLRRKFNILKSQFLYDFISLEYVKNSDHFRDVYHDFKSTVECFEFDNTPVNLKWTAAEERKGSELLKNMGVDSWYVCFHARDNNYLKVVESRGDASYHDYRDCNIDNYIEAMEYITSQGGYAIRMGNFVDKPLNNNNPMIIDYASNHRSDFMDIYLSSHCKFYVGCTAGLMLVPTVFNVPVVSTNFIPYWHSGLSKNEIMIHKKLWSREKKRYLTFEEILSSDICGFLRTELYEAQQIEVEENSSDEILSITKEMNTRIDGNLEYSYEDNALQRMYRDLFKLNPTYYYNYTTRLGRDWLKKNRDLLCEVPSLTSTN